MAGVHVHVETARSGTVTVQSAQEIQQEVHVSRNNRHCCSTKYKSVSRLHQKAYFLIAVYLQDKTTLFSCNGKVTDNRAERIMIYILALVPFFLFYFAVEGLSSIAKLFQEIWVLSSHHTQG